MWANEKVFYQIYPMGFCDAPKENDGVVSSRILKVNSWVDHIRELGIGAVYFSPVFESGTHGYDTHDFSKIDARLGTNENFSDVCKNLHGSGIRVVLDGVFNHVGRGFWAFKDVLEKRESSKYRDWFNIDFGGNSPYNDGFWYEGWEGHYELVKLNLSNNHVVDHIFSCIQKWIDEFDIDGLRLDVAYLLSEDFLRKLHGFCRSRKEDFFLLGEMIHGDYNRIVNDQMLDSATNYECYKGLHSSFNSLNFFEISYSLNRQFGPENWTLYKGKHLFCFADNHDVSRIASELTQKEQIPALYAVLMCMPGIPCVYYGSEWGAQGHKSHGDWGLRPSFDAPVKNGLYKELSGIIKAREGSKAFAYGSYENETVRNKQWVMKRIYDNEIAYLAVNAENVGCTIECRHSGSVRDLISGELFEVKGSIDLPPFGYRIFTTAL